MLERKLNITILLFIERRRFLMLHVYLGENAKTLSYLLFQIHHSKTMVKIDPFPISLGT